MTAVAWYLAVIVRGWDSEHADEQTGIGVGRRAGSRREGDGDAADVRPERTPAGGFEQVEGQLTSSSECLRGIVAGLDEHARVDPGGFRSPLTLTAALRRPMSSRVVVSTAISGEDRCGAGRWVAALAVWRGDAAALHATRQR